MDSPAAADMIQEIRPERGGNMATAVRKSERGGRKSASSAQPNGMAFRIFNDNGGVRVPSWVVDHESYRRWAKSDDFPTRGWFSYLDGIFWADLSM